MRVIVGVIELSVTGLDLRLSEEAHRAPNWCAAERVPHAARWETSAAAAPLAPAHPVTTRPCEPRIQATEPAAPPHDAVVGARSSVVRVIRRRAREHVAILSLLLRLFLLLLLQQSDLLRASAARTLQRAIHLD